MDLFKLVGTIAIEGVDKVESALDSASKKAASVGKGLQDAGKKISGVGKALAPVSAASAGALVGATKAASDFSDGMAKMSTLFDTTRVDVSKLSNDFLELSKKTGISATELAEAGYQALSAGVSVEKSANFVETAGKLSKAGFTSTTTAVDVLTTAMNAYGSQAGSADQIANKLIRTQNLGKTTVDELASSMGKIIPTASSMNVNIDNLCTVYTQLTKQGIATAESTTYANSMLNELGKSSTTVGKALMEKTGKSFQELMADGNDLSDVLVILQEYSEETGTGFNELWGSAEAGKAALAILNGGADEFKDTLKTMSSQTDDMAVALEKLNTPSEKAKKAWNNIKVTGIKLGQTLIENLEPALERICDSISKAAEWFGNLDEDQQMAIVDALAFTAVLSPLIIGIGKVTTALGSMVEAAKLVSPAFKGIKGTLTTIGSNAGTAASGLGTSLAGIGTSVGSFLTADIGATVASGSIAAIGATIGTALVGGIVAAIAGFNFGKWIGEKISEAVGDEAGAAAYRDFHWFGEGGFFPTVGEEFGYWMEEDVKPTFAKLGDGISESFNSAKEKTATAFEGIKTSIQDKLYSACETVTTKSSEIKQKISESWDNVKLKTSEAWENVKSKTSETWTNVKTKVSESTSNVKQKVSESWSNVKQKTQETWTNVKQKISEAVENAKQKTSDMKNTITNNFNTAKDNVINAMNRIKEGISTAFSSAVEAVKNGMSRIKEALSEKLPSINLPVVGNAINTAAQKLGIKKHAKGGIMTKPTVFGFDGSDFHIGGEAGAEAILPIEKLKSYISESVGKENQNIEPVLSNIYELLKQIDKHITGSNKSVVAPIYIGEEKLEEVMISTKKRVNFKSGGLVSV